MVLVEVKGREGERWLEGLDGICMGGLMKVFGD